jgi:hypothetical protein
MYWCVSVSYFLLLSEVLSLIFHVLITMSGDLLFELNLIGDLCTPYSWMFPSIPRLGEFSVVIYFNRHPCPFPLFSSSGNPFMWFLVSWWCPITPSFHSFFSFCSSDWVISNVLISSSLILLLDQVCCLSFILNFQFKHCILFYISI